MPPIVSVLNTVPKDAKVLFIKPQDEENLGKFVEWLNSAVQMAGREKFKALKVNVEEDDLKRVICEKSLTEEIKEKIENFKRENERLFKILTKGGLFAGVFLSLFYASFVYYRHYQEEKIRQELMRVEKQKKPVITQVQVNRGVGRKVKELLSSSTYLEADGNRITFLSKSVKGKPLSFLADGYILQETVAPPVKEKEKCKPFTIKDAEKLHAVGTLRPFQMFFTVKNKKTLETVLDELYCTPAKIRLTVLKTNNGWSVTAVAEK